MTSQEFLKSIGACPDGANAVGTRTLKVAVENSVRPDWLYWLVAWNADQRGWPTRGEIVASLLVCVTKFESPDTHVFAYLSEARRGGSREAFVKLVRKIVVGISDNHWAEMCNVFRSTLSIPFLETLDK
jgi:hypothetical protein